MTDLARKRLQRVSAVLFAAVTCCFGSMAAGACSQTTPGTSSAIEHDSGDASAVPEASAESECETRCGHIGCCPGCPALGTSPSCGTAVACQSMLIMCWRAQEGGPYDRPDASDDAHDAADE